LYPAYVQRLTILPINWQAMFVEITDSEN